MPPRPLAVARQLGRAGGAVDGAEAARLRLLHRLELALRVGVAARQQQHLRELLARRRSGPGVTACFSVRRLALRGLAQQGEARLPLAAGEGDPALGGDPLDLDLLVPVGVAALQGGGGGLQRLDVGCRRLRTSGAGGADRAGEVGHRVDVRDAEAAGVPSAAAASQSPRSSA